MLFSIAMILIVGMLLGWICQKVKLPSLLGMLVTGMLLGPYVLNLLDKNILQISPEPAEDRIDHYFEQSRSGA